MEQLAGSEDLSSDQQSGTMSPVHVSSKNESNSEINANTADGNNGPAVNDASEEAAKLRTAASALMTEYQQSGNIQILTKAIRLLRQPLVQLPRDHPDYGLALDSLANAIHQQYEYTGDANALAECIALKRDALSSYPQGHSTRGASLTNLANTLMTYYKHNGDLDSLAECISLNRDALALYPQGHPSRGASLTDLAAVFMMHYEYSGNLESLANCISLLRDGLGLRPEGHPDRQRSLSSLIHALSEDYKQSGAMNALRESISLQRDALALAPQSYYNRTMLLNNLANSLSTLYDKSGDVDALAECITLNQNALTLLPDGHPDRGRLLRDLSTAYILKFDSNSDEQALHDAMTCAKEILKVYFPGHSQLQDAYHLIARIQLKESPRYNLDEALDSFKQVFTEFGASPRRRLQDAIKTLRLVEIITIGHPPNDINSKRILDLYLSTTELLPLVVKNSFNDSDLRRELPGYEQLCCAAALCAVKCGQPSLAVQFNEEGRALFWSEALRLRSSALNTLPINYRETLRNLFREIEQGSVGLSKGPHDRVDLERRAEYRRQVNMRAEELIANIRQRPGFDRFLKTPLFEELRHAASSGFVVVIISNKDECHAIVIHADSPLLSIALDAIKGNVLDSLCKAVSESGIRDCKKLPQLKEGSIRDVEDKKHQMYEPLAAMWRTIVNPVIDYLGLQKAAGRDRPRVHWCSSGRLSQLPLHAAGIYSGEPEERICASDYIASSYTPSLSVLVKAREGFTPIPRDELRAALYADSGEHGGQSEITKTLEEVQTAANVLKAHSAGVDNEVNAVPTVASVLETATQTHILHLSCPGREHENPLESCFTLTDQSLAISDLFCLNLKKAVLAYLSLYCTIIGDEQQLDQPAHLAESMIFCGFRSVVGTMRKTYDNDSCKVAKWFYEALLENKMIGLDDIPYALDLAVEKLRKEGALACWWASYMHIGA